MKIQYGCGTSTRDGWLNYDASPTLRLQRMPVIGRIVTAGRAQFPENALFGDVTTKLPLADGSVDFAYCSHVLEHLSLHDCRRALRETMRILRPGGVFRGVMPDLGYIVRQYSSNGTADAANQFMRDTILGVEKRRGGLVAIAESVFGNSNHLWLWDYLGIEAELKSAGFNSIRTAEFGDSTAVVFSEIEEQSRWSNALGVEAIK